MMKSIIPVVLMTILTACGTTVTQVNVEQAIEITDRSRVKPIAITKVVAKIRRGTVVGKYKVGAFCIGNDEIKWRSGNKIYLTDVDLHEVFQEELEVNGWPVVGSTEDLFSGYDISGAEVLVAGRIVDLESELCAPLSGFGNWDAKGSMRMSVEWQVFSPARRKLIGKIETSGSAILDNASDDAGYELLSQSYGVAVNNLLAKNDFYELVEKSSGLSAGPDTSNAQLINNYPNNYKSLESALDAAKKSTVVIRTASAHGSGFAIGDGDFVLTNSHVVGEANNVTLVTQDGLEINGLVHSVSRERDIAIIKINAVKLPALHINAAVPSSGARVFAVGAPLDETLSGSVTSGIISGARLMDGLSWIQSDVAISGGNSGGPLLDQNGSVIGIATAGFMSGGSQVGLNLFIPINSALSHMNLKLE